MKQRKKNYFMWFLILAPMVLTWLCFKHTTALGYSDYKDLLNTLLNISAITFAIIGAWIAVIYPDLIGGGFSEDKDLSEIDTARHDINILATLIEVILGSSLVMVIVLSFQFMFPIMQQMEFLGFPKDILKALVFLIILFMTLVQINAIFKVVAVNYRFLRKLRVKNNEDNVKNKLRKRSP